LKYEEVMPESQDLCMKHGSIPEALPNRVNSEKTIVNRHPQGIVAVVQIQLAQ